jgi:hypothetical protein
LKLFLSTEAKIDYLDRLVGKVFKILPMYEEKDPNINIYIHGILISMNNANDLFDYALTDILIDVKSLYQTELVHKDFRKKVLDSATEIKKIKKRVGGSND